MMALATHSASGCFEEIETACGGAAFAGVHTLNFRRGWRGCGAPHAVAHHLTFVRPTVSLRRLRPIKPPKPSKPRRPNQPQSKSSPVSSAPAGGVVVSCEKAGAALAVKLAATIRANRDLVSIAFSHCSSAGLTDGCDCCSCGAIGAANSAQSPGYFRRQGLKEWPGRHLSPQQQPTVGAESRKRAVAGITPRQYPRDLFSSARLAARLPGTLTSPTQQTCRSQRHSRQSNRWGQSPRTMTFHQSTRPSCSLISSTIHPRPQKSVAFPGRRSGRRRRTLPRGRCIFSGRQLRPTSGSLPKLEISKQLSPRPPQELKSYSVASARS